MEQLLLSKIVNVQSQPVYVESKVSKSGVTAILSHDHRIIIERVSVRTGVPNMELTEKLERGEEIPFLVSDRRGLPFFRN